MLAVNFAALLLVAVWFRCRSLDHIPGINGDEAWYGAKALELLREHKFHIQTPTGNAPNPFFFGPAVLLHVFFPPSITLLRSIAVGSGLAALGVNWLLCRWVFDSRTALISTLVLALLPINIAYSRFAWDASQSVLATLPIVYFSLAAVRFREQQSRFIMVAVLAQIAALLVHLTNLLTGAAIVAALATSWRWEDVKRFLAVGAPRRRAAVALLSLVVVLASLLVWGMASGSPRLARFTKRMGSVGELIRPQTTPHYLVVYPRLFTGDTVYQDVAGSRSWLQWPSTAEAEGWGVDAVLFWGLVAAALALLWRSAKRDGRTEDRVLISAWALALVGFLLIAGPRSLIPGWQRYAMCLVVPTTLLVSRGLALGFAACSPRWRLAFVGVALPAAWLVLADYHAHYFRFIERTGGQGHSTFRTAAVEPKVAALRYVLQQRTGTPSADSTPVWIVAGEYWNYWPLRYLAMGEEGVRVVGPEEIDGSRAYEQALEQGRVWCVEFSDSEHLDRARKRLAGRKVHEQRIADYGGRPLLCILHAE